MKARLTAVMKIEVEINKDYYLMEQLLTDHLWPSHAVAAVRNYFKIITCSKDTELFPAQSEASHLYNITVFSVLFSAR